MGFLIFFLIALNGRLALAEPTGGSTASTMPATIPATIPAMTPPQSPSQQPIPYAAGTHYQPASGAAMIDPFYEKCGQDCYHEKANENISLQASYILKKIEFLSFEDSEGRYSDAKREVLGSFCREAEPLNGCIERYVAMNRFWFVKVRSALANNQESANKFYCEKMSPDGKTCLKAAENTPSIVSSMQDAPGLVKGPVPEKLKRAQVPFFSKYDELKLHQPSAQQLASVQDGVMDDQAMLKYQPNLEDFVRFKTIYKDPNNPSKGTMEVPETGENRIDKVAYQRALQAWKEGEFHGDALETLAGRKDFKQERAQDVHKFKNDLPAGQSVNRYLYNEARGEYIDEINQDVNRKGPFNSTTSSASFPGGKQGSPPPPPSSASAPLPPSTKPHTGNEEVVAPMSTGGNRKGMYSTTYSPNGFTSTVAQPKGSATPPAPTDDFLNPFF